MHPNQAYGKVKDTVPDIHEGILKNRAFSESTKIGLLKVTKNGSLHSYHILK
jgi:hypothetical protein